jgi:hypothetical protein
MRHPSIHKSWHYISPTSGGRSVGIFRLPNKGHGVCFFVFCPVKECCSLFLSFVFLGQSRKGAVGKLFNRGSEVLRGLSDLLPPHFQLTAILCAKMFLSETVFQGQESSFLRRVFRNPVQHICRRNLQGCDHVRRFLLARPSVVLSYCLELAPEHWP